MANIEALWEGGPQFIQSEHFKLGTDSVLLADFVNTASRKRGIDLGCGSGILPLLLMQRSPALSMTGLEINPAAAEVARENLRINGLFGRGHITVGDIRECRSLFPSGSFELAVARHTSSPAAERCRRTQTRRRRGRSLTAPCVTWCRRRPTSVRRAGASASSSARSG